MPFKETKTLINDDSDVKLDVKTLARIEISDIEYLLDLIDKGNIELRLETILYESIISKLSSVFQLAMRAFEYLEKTELKRKLIESFNKSNNTSTGKIGKYREDLFHEGIHFFEKTIIYPFGIIEGRGFNAIYVKKGATLDFKGIWKFNSNESEYAITSEGVFEIINSETKEEKWIKIEEFPTLTVSNPKDIRKIITDSLDELKIVWSEISKILKKGDGIHEFSFKNNYGKWVLFSKDDGEITRYDLKMKLIIDGQFSIDPPENIEIKNNKIFYHYK